MSKETEIKLRISRQTLETLPQHPVLTAYHPSPWQSKVLYNQYFDTPSCELSHARVALRIRRDGETLIQTLKTSGHRVAGVAERDEWNWPLSDNTLDPARLDDDCWPAALAELDKSKLQPVFTTDFVRHQTQLRWQEHGRTMHVEMALDDGAVSADNGEESLCELELELCEGDLTGLIGLAERLAEHFALLPCDISKAERGYRLVEPEHFHVCRAKPVLSADSLLDDAFATLIEHLLNDAQRLAEQYRFNGHWRLLESWLQKLDELGILLISLGPVVPRASTRPLRDRLTAILDDWQPIMAQARQDSVLRNRMAERFRQELQTPRWGSFFLTASAWLVRRDWTVGRNTRAERQGALPLGKWLHHLLREEAKALPLATLHRPGVMHDQRPRLQRLLIWLHLAREAVDLPEKNRLYGELSKLLRLADETPEQPGAVEAQSRILARQTSWKELLR